MFLTDWAFGSRAGPQEKMKELKENKHPDSRWLLDNREYDGIWWSVIQWPFQDPKLEVPTIYIYIYKAYFLGLCKGIYPQNMAKHMVLTYLHCFLGISYPSKSLSSADLVKIQQQAVRAVATIGFRAENNGDSMSISMLFFLDFVSWDRMII